MGYNVAQKLIASHLVSGDMTAGREIALRIDQTLTQDATGTLVMLELEAMDLDRARAEVAVQYVDNVRRYHELLMWIADREIVTEYHEPADTARPRG